MKHRLTTDDIQAAVLGGAILGGGGGGHIEPGEQAARLALEVGVPELWSVDEFNPEDLTMTVALVGSPAAVVSSPSVRPAQTLRAIELMRGQLPAGQALVAINTNENGAQTTVNGWFQAAMTGLPVLDLACNGRAHPSGVMGSLGLHAQPGYRSVQGFCGGDGASWIEGVAVGQLERASAVVRQASVDAGGMVAVARNPTTIDYARRNGAPGGITHAIALGRAYLDGGVAGAMKHLDGRVVAQGSVSNFRLEERSGRDVGIVELDDAARTKLHFINEFMLLEQHGDRIGQFPDLIMTFDAQGRPLVTASMRAGQQITVVLAPRSSLKLSRAMFMPELYRPMEALLGQAFAPQTAEAS